VGPWGRRPRLIDMKAQMEKSGVSAKDRRPVRRGSALMLFLTDPATGSRPPGCRKVASRSGKGFLLYGNPRRDGSISGADVGMPTPGKYMFKAEDRIRPEEGERGLFLHVELSGSETGKGRRTPLCASLLVSSELQGSTP